MGAEPQELVVFDFSNPKDFALWQVIDDTVMGGISRSSFKPGAQGNAVFSGEVSLENFGGFCSSSSQPVKNHDLAAFTGITFRVRGDGKKYKATLKTDSAFTGFAYQYEFAAQSGIWINVTAPFDKFVPFFRGVRQTGAGSIDTGSIKSFGFIIADKQAGPFRLEIDSIKAYK